MFPGCRDISGCGVWDSVRVGGGVVSGEEENTAACREELAFLHEAGIRVRLLCEQTLVLTWCEL